MEPGTHRRAAAASFCRRHGLLAVLLALTSTAGPRAQDAEETAPRVFFESVDVAVVNVEVYVTDRQGRRVTGLGPEDFEILEDGRPVAITNFYAVEDGRHPAPTPAGAPAPGPSPPAAAPAAAAAARPQSQRLHLILYFDNEFLRPFNRNRVVREVRDFLRRTVGPQDRVMLVTFDRELHLRHPFTADLRSIAEALTGIEMLSGAAVAAETERRDVLRRVDLSSTIAEAQSHVEFYAKSVYHHLGLSIDSLKQLVGSLAGLPGRKALLYVSDGIPMTAGEDLFHYLDQKFPGRISGKLLASRYSARRRFAELTAQANANRVTFYTLEAAGLRLHSSLSAESRGTAAGGSTLDADFARDLNHQQTLQMLAFDTGGLASFNSNNITGALERMAADFGTYYSLGYRPVHTAAGRYHRIEVRVKERGVEVRHRAGYRDKTPEARIAEGTLASLFYGYQANPLEIRLEVADGGRRQEDGHYLLPLRVLIPLAKVALIPYEALHRGELVVSLAVIDEEGRVSAVQQTPVPITIPNADVETAQDQLFVYEAELLMREGLQQVAVGVRDQAPGESSFLRTAVWAGRPRGDRQPETGGASGRPR